MLDLSTALKVSLNRKGRSTSLLFNLVSSIASLQPLEIHRRTQKLAENRGRAARTERLRKVCLPRNELQGRSYQGYF